jgi:hypothetical protein
MTIDDMQLTGQVVPEPATLGLLGLAVAGLITLRKRHIRA